MKNSRSNFLLMFSLVLPTLCLSSCSTSAESKPAESSLSPSFEATYSSTPGTESGVASSLTQTTSPQGATKATEAAPTAGDARADYLSFVADVKKEIAQYSADLGKPKASFQEYFRNSYTHFKRGMADEDIQYVINIYVPVFGLHPEVEVNIDETAVRVNGNEAKISSNGIVYVEHGKELGRQGASTYTLAYENNRWVISDIPRSS